MEPLDTILYEEGTQVPLNPHTTSSQVSHKDTTVGKALEETVNFVPQELTPEQQAQARENINALGDEAGVINEEYIATGAVTTGKIKDGAVTTPKIEDGAITKEKLGAKAVTISRIDDGAVTTPKIAGEAITEDKLASQSVSSKKIKDDAVTGDKLADGAVTSTKLATGARRPIIFTPDTTEVDEETYQKLLSDNVDVLFKLSETVLLPLQGRDKSDTYLYLYFSFINFDADALDIYDSTINAVSLLIKSSTPHTVSSSVGEKSFDMFLSNYIDTSITQSVFQEIDLTGTDEERKAKLDQFEADWKALTGADTLEGARFVGQVTMENGEDTQVILNLDIDYNYSGISITDSGATKFKKIVVSPADGSVTSVPLFYHLDPVEIFTDNTPEHKKANLDNITAYRENLDLLEVNTSMSFQIPIYIESTIDIGNVAKSGFLVYSYVKNGYKPYTGLVLDSDETGFGLFGISPTGEYFEETDYVLYEVFDRETTRLENAIKNFYTSVPLTDTASSNKLQLEKFLSKVLYARVMHCTYKDVYAGTLYKINSDWYGLLVKNTNNPADNINIKLSADGTIITSNSAQ